MRSLLKYIYRTLLPEKMARSIDLFPHLRIPQATDRFTERRVVVLSPHPDDDVIGCGGTMHRYHLLGADVTAVYMTDGRKGNANYSEEELVPIRREEARRAARAIGIKRLVFLENRDAELSATPGNVGRLTGLLGELEPEAVFLPFFNDTHADHAETAKMLFSSLRKKPAGFMCYLYSVWTPLPYFNSSVDITPYIDVKKKAVSEHRSQLETIDLLDASLSLSRYYSIISNGSGGKGWIEPFLSCTASEFVRLGRAAGL